MKTFDLLQRTAATALILVGLASGFAQSTTPATSSASAKLSQTLDREWPRQFISHRGVHLRSTIAGENSLESIRLARRAGFAAIEMDVRLTADGHLVVMHDETLNRTCLNADGTELKEPVPVSSVTLAELRQNFMLKADAPSARSKIPILAEFLAECRREKLTPFIEPKLKDSSGAHYRDIIRVANEVLGPGSYIITSNNFANRVIRDLGITDVRLMGILYQTTFEEIAGLGNVIMAISTARFSATEFAQHMLRSIEAGIPTESNADGYRRFAMIDAHPVDYVATDFLAPDLSTTATVRTRRDRFEDFKSQGQITDGFLKLPAESSLGLKETLQKTTFGGIYLEMEMKGECKVRLGDQQFAIQNSSLQRIRFQLMVHDAVPDFQMVASTDCEIKSIRVTLAEY